MCKDPVVNILFMITCILWFTYGDKENQEAFVKHFDEQLSLYKSIVAVNLAELVGKEKAISDAYLNAILDYNCKDVTYILVDRKGMICDQNGVFRINCVDCLDRTNVVQTAIARICRKLGILPPDENLPGDYTRTGSRKLTGLMKDGVNSANRYYLRFKDNYRQAAIDLTLGQPVTHELIMTSSKIDQQEEDLNELLEKEENLKMLIEDCKTMIIVEPEQCLGGWSLIDADPVTGDPDRQDMDTILLLSQRSVYVAWYDDEEEEFVQYQRIFLEDIEKIEIVIAIKNMEEARESLKAIYQGFAAAREILSLQLELDNRQKLDRKKTRPHPEIQDIHKQQQENSLAGLHVPRDVSMSDLGKLKVSGRESPGQRSTKSSPGSASPGIMESPKSSPKSQRKRNLFSAFDMTNIKKNINSGLKNISVPKIELQNMDLMRRVKSLKSKKEVERSKFHLSAEDLTDTDSLESVQSEEIEERNKHSQAEKRYSKDDIDVTAIKSMKNHINLDIEKGKVSVTITKHSDDDDLKMPDTTTKHSSDADLGILSESGESLEDKADEDKMEMVSSTESPIKTENHFVVPKIKYLGSKNRKTQRILETTEQMVLERLGTRELHTQIIFFNSVRNVLQFLFIFVCYCVYGYVLISTYCRITDIPGVKIKIAQFCRFKKMPGDNFKTGLVHQKNFATILFCVSTFILKVKVVLHNVLFTDIL
ncbi:hypothetical protein KUTeg_005074 [Tegillarca granosa]|uniref:Uncharacterized protein n=1 Tax=Tegillarca granosa TaxID=220873 RepID=A0ABQ9FLM7_TEGGR|nr:hypothetical protein KUTeg_005074 [Tegillarca granosa]